MHLIQSLKNEYCFDLPLFSKYPTTSIKSYFYKMTNFIFRTPGLYCICYTVFYENTSALVPINSFKLLLRGMGAENLCDSLIIHKSDQVDPWHEILTFGTGQGFISQLGLEEHNKVNIKTFRMEPASISRKWFLT